MSDRNQDSSSPAAVGQNMERPIGVGGSAPRASDATWRVGSKIAKNIYVGDELAGQFQREEWAHEAVAAVNTIRSVAAPAPVQGDAVRGAVAKVVDPEVFRLIDHYAGLPLHASEDPMTDREERVFKGYPQLKEQRDKAFAKADEILAALRVPQSPPPGEGSGRDTVRDLANRYADKFGYRKDGEHAMLIASAVHEALNGAALAAPLADPAGVAGDAGVSNSEWFEVGDRVEKFTGDYRLAGEVRSRFTTRAGKERYVVEHDPGFLHIYGPQNLRSVPATPPSRTGADPAGGCNVSPYSSRICERGTKGCTVEHARLAVLFPEHEADPAGSAEFASTSCEPTDG